MLNKYIYSKIMSSYNNEDGNGSIKLLLSPEEKNFIKRLHIDFKEDTDNYVTINRAEFIGKIVA